MLIQTIPKNKIATARLFFEFILLILKSKYPTSKLNNAHKTFVSGDERPLPGGVEKGEGNGFPETPFTKWGTTLVKKEPAKNTAR